MERRKRKQPTAKEENIVNVSLYFKLFRMHITNRIAWFCDLWITEGKKFKNALILAWQQNATAFPRKYKNIMTGSADEKCHSHYLHLPRCSFFFCIVRCYFYPNASSVAKPSVSIQMPSKGNEQRHFLWNTLNDGLYWQIQQQQQQPLTIFSDQITPISLVHLLWMRYFVYCVINHMITVICNIVLNLHINWDLIES